MAREMKDSGIDWIGKIPEDWELHRMKSCIADRTSGAWGNEALGDEGDIVCLRIADFDYARFCFKDTSMDDLTIRNYDKKTIDSLLLQKGDILIEKSGGGEKTPVGRTVLFDKDYPALYANFMDRLRCTDLVTSEWMQYVFVTFYKNEYSRNYIKQTTGIQNLDLTSMMASERIPVPTLSEQQRIVAFLDNECGRIDAVIEQTRASIEEYKKLRLSVITQAVTTGIQENREMKITGAEWLNCIPQDWSMERGKELFTEVDNRSEDGREELLTVSQYTGITPRSKKNVNMFEAESLEGYKVCDIGDIAANTMWLWAGAIGVSKFRGVISPSYNIYRQINNRFDSEYLDYLLRTVPLVQHFESLSTGIRASRLRLYPQQFLNIRYPVPPTQEQKEIVHYLHEKIDGMDVLIQKKERFLLELETYKKSLIYEYVTGKKEVSL